MTLKASILVFAIVAAVPLKAHHVVRAEYDVDQPITIRGIITQALYQNPHANYYLDVTSEDSKITTWILETASPNVLIRRGWNKDSVGIGDQVTVTVYPARDGKKRASAAEFIKADGQELDSSDSGVWGQLDQGGRRSQQ